MQTLDIDKLAIALRSRRGSKSLRDASEDSGVPVSSLNRIELGNLPSLETFIRVCQWMDMPLDYFVVDVDRPHAHAA